MKMNGNRKKIWIRAGVISSVLLIAAGCVAWNLFHDADVLEIEDGLVKGSSETWRNRVTSNWAMCRPRRAM